MPLPLIFKTTLKPNRFTIVNYKLLSSDWTIYPLNIVKMFNVSIKIFIYHVIFVQIKVVIINTKVYNCCTSINKYITRSIPLRSYSELKLTILCP